MDPDGVKDIRRTLRKIPEIMLIVLGFGISEIRVDLLMLLRLDLWRTGGHLDGS